MPATETELAKLIHIAEDAEKSVKRSAEVRWFVQADLPDLLQKWFAMLGPGRKESMRTDVYLATARADLNVKQREGRLEIKRRDQEEGAVMFVPPVGGHPERWRKWITPETDEVREILDGHSEADWIRVGKTRTLQSFSVGETVRAVPVYSERTQGCNVELTRLKVDSEFWWSVCFEAFGSEDQLSDILTRTAMHLFSAYAPPDLTSERSYGYPQWLLHLSGQPGAQG